MISAPALCEVKINGIKSFNLRGLWSLGCAPSISLSWGDDQALYSCLFITQSGGLNSVWLMEEGVCDRYWFRFRW